MKPAWRFAFFLLFIPSVLVPEQRPEPHWSELQGSMEKMHAGAARIHPSGDPDLDFVRLMLAHHQAAVEMAKTELKYGKDPQIRRLAQEIITDQQSEIELMRLWLKQRDPHSSDSSNR